MARAPCLGLLFLANVSMIHPAIAFVNSCARIIFAGGRIAGGTRPGSTTIGETWTHDVGHGNSGSRRDGPTRGRAGRRPEVAGEPEAARVRRGSHQGERG